MPHLKLPPDLDIYYRIDDYTDPWERPETVLFIYGAAENTEAFRAWVPHVSRRHRMLRFDLRGFGKSAPIAEDFQFSTDLVVDDMVRLIGHCAAEGVHVVAAKSGGIAAVRLAADRPDLLRSLTLVGCRPFPPQQDGTIEIMARPGGMRAWARSTMRRRMGSRMPERGLDAWADLMGSSPLASMKAYFDWATQTDMLPDLPRIQCPVLYIDTQASRPGEELDTYRKLVRRLETAVVESDAFHVAGAEPDATAAAALAFIGRHARTGT